MPLESVACPKCGSSDIIEYKAGSYICQHCDGVFAHINPSSVTVSVRREVCRCGNNSQGKCGTCDSAICGGCIIGRAEELRHKDVWLEGGGWYKLLGVESGGYRLEVGSNSCGMFYSRTVSNELKWRKQVLERGQWRKVADDGDPRFSKGDSPFGPPESHVAEGVVPLGKVTDHVARSGASGYVCLSCLSEAAERVCAELAAGTVCLNPFCGRAASVACPCCREPNCGECLYACMFSNEDWRPVKERFGRVPGIVAGTSSSFGISGGSLSVCAACYPEYQVTDAEQAPIEQEYKGTNPRKMDREQARLSGLFGQRSAAILSRWEQQATSGCQRRLDSPSETIPYRAIVLSR